MFGFRPARLLPERECRATHGSGKGGGSLERAKFLSKWWLLPKIWQIQWKQGLTHGRWESLARWLSGSAMRVSFPGAPTSSVFPRTAQKMASVGRGGAHRASDVGRDTTGR